MNNKSNDPRHNLLNIADLYIDDLFATSDEDLLAEAKSSPVLKKSGVAAKAAYQQALQTIGQKRLRAAREALENDAAENKPTTSNVDIAKARKLIARLAANDSKFGHKITLAARNLVEISDQEVLDIINDLKRLGALPEEGEW